MSEITHTGLGVSLRKREDQGFYEFGVVIDGAFVPFTAARIGDIDPILADAREKAAQATETTGTTSQPTS